MFRSALVTILLNGGATVLAFINQLLIAAAFGASQTLDAYFLGISLPMAVASNLNQMLVYAIVPVLVFGGRTGAGRGLASAFLFVLFGIAALLVVLGVVVGPHLVELLSGTAGKDRLATAQLSFLLFSVAGAFIVLTGMLTTVANANRSFVWPIVGAYGLPVGSALTILLLRDRMGPPAIAVGAMAGSFAGCLLLAWVLRRELVPPPYPSEVWTTVRAALAKSPLYLLGLLPFSALTISDAFWGSRAGPSVVSHLGYANRIIVTLAGVLMMGPVSVLGQRLSEHHAASESSEFLRSYAKGVRVLLWLGGYASVVLVVCAEPIVSLLFQRGQFSRGDTEAVAALLRIMGIGLIGTNCAVLSFRALFSRHEASRAAILGVGLFAVYAVLSGLFSLALGATGIAWAYTVSWWAVTGIAMLWVVGKRFRLGAVSQEAGGLLATLLVTGLAASFFVGGVSRLGFGDSKVVELIKIVGASASSLLVFGLLAVKLFRAGEVVSLFRRIGGIRAERTA